MKKFYAYLFAAVAWMGFAACSEDATTDEVAPEVENGQVTMVEFFAQADNVRTELDDAQKTKWHKEDLISLFDGENKEFKVKDYTDPYNVSFEGELTKGEAYMALYPHTATATADVKNCTISNVVVPAAQTLTAGTFAEGAAVAVAYTTDNTLSFKNVVSILKFQVATACETITITSDEPLAGTIDVTYDGQNEPTISVKKAEYTLTLTGPFATGQTYYATVLPGASNATYEVRFNGYLSTKKTAGKPRQRSVMMNMQSLPAPELRLVPNSNWKQANARFAVYLFGGDTDAWIGLTNDGNDVYACDLPLDKGYKACIFCRMNPDNQTNGWTTKWSQTQDMYFTDAKNDYTCTILEHANAWEKAGYWDLEKDYIYLYPNDNWSSSDPRFAVYLFGNGEGWANMEQEGGSSATKGRCIYRYKLNSKFPNLIFCRMNPDNATNGWSTRWNQSEDINSAVNYGGQVYVVKQGSWDAGGGDWVQ